MEPENFGIDDIHVHALSRVPDHDPRHYVGWVENQSRAYTRRDGPAPMGGPSGVRCERLPIREAGHFYNTVSCNAGHAAAGAVVWRAKPVVGENPPAEFGPEPLLAD